VSTLTRYWLLQVPGWILLILVLGAAGRWFDLPSWMALLIFVIWVVKDAILYPILKPGYESGAIDGLRRLVGLIGVVKQDLDPEGFILVNGEWWMAVAEPTTDVIRVGQSVEVKSAEGMRLTVRRCIESPRFEPRF